jgi:hypothetical protein
VDIAARNTWGEAICVLLARAIRNPNRRLRKAAVVFVPLAFGIYPLAWLAGRLLSSDFMTTGYNVVARGPGRANA